MLRFNYKVDFTRVIAAENDYQFPALQRQRPAYARSICFSDKPAITTDNTDLNFLLYRVHHWPMERKSSEANIYALIGRRP